MTKESQRVGKASIQSDMYAQLFGHMNCVAWTKCTHSVQMFFASTGESFKEAKHIATYV